MEHASIKVKYESRLNVKLNNIKLQRPDSERKLPNKLGLEASIYVHPIQYIHSMLVKPCWIYFVPHILAFEYLSCGQGNQQNATHITPCILKDHSNWTLLALPEGEWEAVLGETRTGSLVAAFMAAISSKRFHVASRLDFISFPWTSSCWNLIMHSL